MPRRLVQAPGHNRHRSLGWLACAWIEHFVVHGPGDVQGERVVLTDEFTLFVVDCYALGDSPTNAHMLYDSVFLSRPKGCNKSGLASYIALFEALGPARYAGVARGGEEYRDPWGMGFRYVYEAGEPMGRHVTTPMIRCLATEEHQVANTYATIYLNLTDEDAPLSQVPGVDAGLERVYLPWGGDIRVSTASSSAKDGGKETFVIFDETHLYSTPELRRMYDTVVRNMVKRKSGKKGAGTWYVETTTMFAPGDESVAEATYEEAEALTDGRRKRGEHRLLYDHRWGDVKDLTDEADLRRALVEAYGDAMEWMDLQSLVNQFYSIRAKVTDSRRYFLNAQTSTSDAWVAFEEWAACGRPDRFLRDRDMVTLGFDGAVHDDATALVACRVADGHLELLGCWERPEGAQGEGWSVDREAVDAAVSQAMRRFAVVGMYADPAHWQDYCDRWHREFAHKMQVQATARKPLEWWTNRPVAMVAALERFYEAVLEERTSYTPADDRVGRERELAATLTRHLLNAKRRPSRSGLQIGKESPKSSRKIDAAMAAVLAFEAAQDAIAKGAKPARLTKYAAKRIR